MKLIMILFLILTSQTPVASFAAQTISPEDAYASTMTNRAILVDVREAEELTSSGIAEFAVWLATTSISARGPSYQHALQKWPKEQKLIFYCRSGRRSEIAADHFATLGYRTFNAGSFQAWKDAGLPIKPFDPTTKSILLDFE
jgi:rhodanese-related sulfurtransferase